MKKLNNLIITTILLSSSTNCFATPHIPMDFSKKVKFTSSVSNDSVNSNETFVAFGLNLGLSGLGIEGRINLYEDLFLRAGVNYASIKVGKGDSQEYNSDPKLTLLTIPVLFDYHPFNNSGFRLSTGLAYNGTSVKAVTKFTDYTETINTSFKRKVAPVLSIGYDSSLMNNNTISFAFDVGAMFTGGVKSKITYSDVRYISPENQTSVAKNLLSVMPVLSAGLKFSL
jgi:hypothetical protein